jgi:hypothetical protein
MIPRTRKSASSVIGEPSRQEFSGTEVRDELYRQRHNQFSAKTKERVRRYPMSSLQFSSVFFTRARN